MSLTGAELLKKLGPSLNAVEESRLTHLATFKKRQPLCFAGWAFVAVLALGLFAGLQSPGIGIGAAVVGGGLVFWIYTGPARDFRRGYKNALLPKIAEEFGNFAYQIDGGIDMSRMNFSKIIPHHHRYSREDYFHGEFEGVGIEFNEAKLVERRGTGKNTRYVIVFKGLFVLLDMNKNFAGHTVVRKDAGPLNFLGGFGSLERIKLEDPEFERQYEVYGSDQVEARYLLTPAFMERLKKLTTSVGAHNLECAFYGDQLLILMGHREAMSAKGLLEPGPLSQTVHQESSIAKIADEFSAICGLVHELKLHENHRV